MFAVLLAISTSCASDAHPNDKSGQVIYLVTMGNTSTTFSKRAAVAIKAFYGIQVEYLGNANLPQKKCHVRNRHIAQNILTQLAVTDLENGDARDDKYLALTDQDIETEDQDDRGVIRKHWGVMGLGRVGGDVSVVSTFRLQGSRDRLIKVTLHEVGHMLNLPHCQSGVKECVMNDVKGKAAVIDNTKVYLCSDCKTEIKF